MVEFNLMSKALFLVLVFNAYAQHTKFDDQISLFERMQGLSYIPDTRFYSDYNNARKNSRWLYFLKQRWKKDKPKIRMELAERLGRLMPDFFNNTNFKLTNGYEVHNNIELSKSSRLKLKQRLSELLNPFLLHFHDIDLLCMKTPSRKYETIGRKVKRVTKKLKRNDGKFVPTISTGSTHLGNFFKGLSHNVNLSEKSVLGKTETHLLSGNYPYHMINEQISNNGKPNPLKTAGFLHAIRSYRPAQKIRTLIGLNPPGYHSSQFIKPSYMWIGLGK